MHKPLSHLKPHLGTLVFMLAVVALIVVPSSNVGGQVGSTGWKVVGWNNLGMHCLDADFSVFTILPPYNTIQAQVINPSGQLITSSSAIRLTYQGVADPAGSINTSSAGKTNYWSFVLALFGVSLPVDVGLLGHNMPGAANTPQPMVFDPALNWFIAEGIPITPFDNAGVKNFYPMMRVTASDISGTVLASTNIVLPVSDEMSCLTCHASGSVDAARPAAGWVLNPVPERDYRLNILRLHDDRQSGDATFTAALAARGYSASGLYATAVAGTPILCAACHLSEALPNTGYPGIPPLTASLHTMHANVVDPGNGLTLESSDNRTACYRCHPGSETRCLRGVMGNAVAADGTMAIQCQSCHGPMSAVGASNRTGWLNEPTCQACHSGTAVRNSGQIRYTSAIDAGGQPRVAADATFATQSNAPAAGLSLYRFSAGHGSLQCSACHGSTHAEYPSSHQNDNVQSIAFQGHEGTIAECSSCHGSSPSTTNGGPHGMHPVGATWVSQHHDASGGMAQCQACHGADYRGTVLSRSFADRTLSTSFGTKVLFRGAQVGCYMCHNGPSNSNRNSNLPAVANNLTTSTAAGTPVTIALIATDSNPLTLRIVSQPENGAVSLFGTTATYFPLDGFSGLDSFTYTAWDGSIDSNLARVTVTVGAGTCSLSSTPVVPLTAAIGASVSFSAALTATGCSGSVVYDWNFGDGSPHSAAANAVHAYAASGTYPWTMNASANGQIVSRSGNIVVAGGCALSSTSAVASTATTGAGVPFSVTVTSSGCSGTVVYDWDFGDGTAHSAVRTPTHTYASAGSYQWIVAASANGQVTSQAGNIAVSQATSSAPTVSGVRALSDPFRIRIDGASFVQGLKVFIGTDTSPWGEVQFSSSQRITLGGGDGLRSKFREGRTVSIRIVNPDGQSVTTSLRR